MSVNGPWNEERQALIECTHAYLTHAAFAAADTTASSNQRRIRLRITIEIMEYKRKHNLLPTGNPEMRERSLSLAKGRLCCAVGVAGGA